MVAVPRRPVLAAAAVACTVAVVGLGLLRPAVASAYSVRHGDTLWSISQHAGVSVDAIIRANNLGNPNLIYPGQNLVIPGTAAAPAAVATYTVKAGDNLTAIAQRLQVSLADLVKANGLGNPNLITPGQNLQVPGSAPPPAPAPAPAAAPPAPAPPTPPIPLAQARDLLVQAARDNGLNPAFVLAVSYWESGFNQGWVSRDGAIGMMQVLPSTAAWAGPALVRRAVDLNNPTDNAEVGAALLRHYLDHFNDPKLAIAAYYQGAGAVEKYGIYPSSESYVNGIWALRNQFNAGLR